MRKAGTVRDQLARLRGRRLANDLPALLLAAAGALAAGLALVSALFAAGWLLAVLAVPLGWLAWRWLGDLGIRRLARRAEQAFPELERRVVPVLELARYRPAGPEGYSAELIDAATDQAERLLSGVPLGRLVDRRRLAWSALSALLGIAALAGYRLGFPAHSSVGLANTLGRPLPVEFVLTPADTSVLPGADWNVRVAVRPAGVFRAVSFEPLDPGPSRSAVRLSAQAPGAPPTDAEGRGDYGVVRGRAAHGFRYRFRALSARSAEAVVRVSEPVTVTGIEFNYRYPAYSGLPASRSSSPELAGLRGTAVDFSGNANQPLDSGRLVLGSDTVALRTEGTSFGGSLVMRADAAGAVELAAGAAGFQPALAISARTMPDEAPLVRLVLPGRDVDLPMSMQVGLAITSLDDFGLGELALEYGRDSLDRRRRVKSLAGRREDTTWYVWDLSDAGLLPGEELRYRVTVEDNDAVSGPKQGSSAVYRVRFPTMAEIYDAAVRQTETTTEELAPLQQTQEQLGQELERIGDQLKKEGKLTWDERQALEQVLAGQQQLGQDIADLRQDVEQMMAEMSEGMTLDQDALERLDQLQQLLSELLPAELQESLEKLARAMQQQSPDMKRALEKFQLDQEQLKKSIDQALEFLKQVLEEQRLEALARKAGDLAEQQERLLAQLETQRPEDLAGAEELLGPAIDSLKNAIDELARQMSDSAAAESLARAAEGMEQDSLSGLAGQTAEKMQQGSKPGAKSSGQKLAQKLKDLSQSLAGMSSGLKKRRSNEVARELLAAAEDLLMVSRQQEELEQALANRADVSADAGRQMSLSDGARVVAESLAALGGRTMSVSSRLVDELNRARVAMQAAAQSLVENRAHAARARMADARSGLDRVVSWVLKALEDQQQGGGMSGGMEGLMQQLSQMTGEQMSINAGTSGMPIPVPGGLSGEQMASLGRLMGRQQALRERLEQLLEQLGGEQPGLTSSLEGLLDEMKQVERDLEQFNVSRDVLERQESILEHLLDAQRSVRQRGFKEERESEAAKPFAPAPAPGMPGDLGERNRLLREEMMRALKQPGLAEYQRLIRAYFESLMNQP